MKGLVVLFVFTVLASPAFAGPADDAAAHSMAFERAVNARDPAAVVALYAPDAHVIWPGEGEEAVGTAGIQKLVSGFLADAPQDARMTLESQTAISLGDGHIAVLGHWRESFTDPAGQPQNVEVRTSEIIKKERGKTLYVVDHASIGVPPAPATPTTQP